MTGNERHGGTGADARAEHGGHAHGRHEAPDTHPMLRTLATLPTAVIGTVAGAFRFGAHPGGGPHGRHARRRPDGPADGPATVDAAARGDHARRGAGVRYTVVDGDTASTIAARFGIPTASLLATNRLGWSSPLAPGRELVLDVPEDGAHRADHAHDTGIRHCTVAEGDSLEDVAYRNGVDLDALLRINGLHRRSLVAGGQSLVLPGSVGAPAA